MEAALRTLDNKFETLVIDLRSNPGGLLVAAIEICDFLLDGGTIVETRERGDRLVEQVQATPGTLVSNDKKIVVLVNRDSASASEVMAACLQDQGRAVIGGERSYGKGTIQEVLALESGRSLLKITTARYFSPNGRSIHRDEGATEEAIWGVKPEPNLEVKFSDKEMLRLQEFWARASFPAIARDVKLPAAVVKEDGDAEPQAEPDPGPFTDTQLQKVLDVLSEIGK